MTDMSLVPLDPEIQQAIAEAGCTLQVGDVFIDDHGSIRRIDGWIKNEYGVYASVTNLNSSWRESSVRLKELPSDPILVPGGDVAAARERAYAAMNAVPEDEEAAGDPGTAIARTNSAKVVQFHIDAIEARRREMTLYERLVKLDLKRVSRAIDAMKKQVRYMERVIRAIELYAGFYEDIVQIQEGAVADISTPVYIFQRVLYMDEEVGICDFFSRTQQRGIDWQNIEEFDRWLTANPENLNWVAPTEKCIVALRPSRQDRHYSDNPFENGFIKANNSRMYLLLRNGENVYRIFSGETIGDRLFPTIAEMEDLLKSLDGSSPERAKNMVLDFKTQALLLQGIFDRTDLMLPLPRPVILTDPADYDHGHFFLVRDAESLIADGHLPFKKWRQALNDAADVGSRVVVGNISWQHQNDNDRFKRYYAGDRTPPAPRRGLYQIEDKGEPSKYGPQYDKLYILYNPGDEIWSRGWTRVEPHDRKNRLSWALRRHDEFWLNYDGLSVDDIEFYLKNRVDREGYLDMMPLLQEVYKQRQIEEPYERDAVTLMASTLDVPEQVVWEAIEWWKTKNKWKRPLMEDDAKAWRMITKRVEKNRDDNPV